MDAILTLRYEFEHKRDFVHDPSFTGFDFARARTCGSAVRSLGPGYDADSSPRYAQDVRGS